MSGDLESPVVQKGADDFHLTSNSLTRQQYLQLLRAFHGPGHPCPLAGSQWVSDVSGEARVLLAGTKIPRGLQGSLKLVHVKNTLDTIFLGPPSCFFFFLRNLRRVKPALSPGPEPITLIVLKRISWP